MGIIQHVEIRGYRSLERFAWTPAPGVNVLLGSGDSGKSTVLSSIALFERRRALSEFDYYKRRTADGFQIDLVVTGIANVDLAAEKTQLPVRGWDGQKLLSLPDTGIAALVFRAMGTPDLDLEYFIVAESGEQFPLTANLRKQLRIFHLTRLDDNSSEFRGASNSLLSRNLAEIDLRAAAQSAFQFAVGAWEDPPDAKDQLDKISQTFAQLGLPQDLLLGIVPPSSAAASLVSAFTGSVPTESIPFERTGEGTRQLSSLALIARMVSEHPLLLIDELEAGLEPHRQRVAAKLASRAVAGGGQAIIVTHAPAVVSSLADCAHWRMASRQAVRISHRLSATVFKMQPEAAFSKLPLVCEGQTELGLVPPFWRHYTGSDLEESGVSTIYGGGHPAALDMLGDLLDAGIQCAGFVDNELEKKGTRERISAKCPLFTWAPLHMPEEALAKWVPINQLESLVEVIAKTRSQFSRSITAHNILALVAKSLKDDEQSRTIQAIVAIYGEAPTRAALYEVLKSHKLLKQEAIAGAVAVWLISTGVPPEMDVLLRPFFSKCKSLL